MNDLQEEYIKDTRIPCQYGRTCYQKNPEHHKKYKHPPDTKRKQVLNKNGNTSKRSKFDSSSDLGVKESEKSSDAFSSSEQLNINEDSNEQIKITKDVSESDSESPTIDMVKNKTYSNSVSASDSDNSTSQAETYERNIDMKNKASPKENKSKTYSNNVSDSDSDHTSQAKTSQRNIDIDVPKEEKNNHTNTSANIPRPCNHKNGHNNDFAKSYIKKKFLLDMPDDFYQFFNLCERLNKNDPSKALSSIGLNLVGPYDILCGKFCGIRKKDEEYLTHWRYFYDPPQMQTILKGDDKTGCHIGYFWDSPDEKPVFMVENHALKNGVLEAIGENIFAAVCLYIDEKKKTADPFKKLQFTKIYNSVKQEAEKFCLDLSKKTKNMSKRNNRVLSRTFNKIGLVVPYERKTQLGYRKMAMSDKNLEELLSQIDKAKPDEKHTLLATLQSEILTWTDIACDECDFGTGIELGWDIICHGVNLNHTAARLLASNYRQLKWDVFAKIAEAHMASRREGCNVSIL